MENHCDHIGSVHGGIPVLTTIINLNDNYTGGELIMFEDTEYKLQQGDVIVFPSVFLYPHKINPILSGTRYSAIAWSS
jgi:predicted 2-oxoglutarate/Fe(II)-dependent dioxygenase YbiX